MLLAAAVVPATPLLVPAVAAGAAADLDEVRAAAVAAVAGLPEVDLVVLGAAPGPARSWSGGSVWSLRGLGVALDGTLGGGASEEGDALPLSLAVGAWLLGAAGRGRDRVSGVSVPARGGPPPGYDLPSLPGDWALLVVADLSARRSTAAPGYLDDRAAAFDAAVGAALAAGDPAALAGIDPDLGEELLAGGTAPLRLLGAVAAGAGWSARVDVESAQHGVGLVVARWARRG